MHEYEHSQNDPNNNKNINFIKFQKIIIGWARVEKIHIVKVKKMVNSPHVHIKKN